MKTKIIFILSLLLFYSLKSNLFAINIPFEEKIEGLKQNIEEIYNYLREKSPAVKIYNVWLEQKAKTQKEIDDAYNNMANIYSKEEYEKAVKSNEIAFKYARDRYYKKAIYYSIKAEKYARLSKNRSIEFRKNFKDNLRKDLDYIAKNLNCMDKNIPDKDKDNRKLLDYYVLNYSNLLNHYRTDKFEGLEEKVNEFKGIIENSKYICQDEDKEKI